MYELGRSGEEVGEESVKVTLASSGVIGRKSSSRWSREPTEGR